jgi:hypothetical protein
MLPLATLIFFSDVEPGKFSKYIFELVNMERRNEQTVTSGQWSERSKRLPYVCVARRLNMKIREIMITEILRLICAYIKLHFQQKFDGSVGER